MSLRFRFADSLIIGLELAAADAQNCPMNNPPETNGNASRALIEARDLRISYGDLVAVDGISFKVAPGEVFGMLGPNGAGKTSTVEIIEGLRTPDSGDAFVNGVSVTQEPRKVKAMIGVQLQQANFFDLLNLREIIGLFAALYETQASADELLDRVGLLSKSKSRSKELSGGQRQRLSIATALVNDPVAVFLDEPTTGLDPRARRNVWEIVNDISDSGKALVMTTHSMEEAENLCDRVAIMDAGKIVARGTPKELIDDLASRGVKSIKGDDDLTLEDVFIDLTGRSLQDEEAEEHDED